LLRLDGAQRSALLGWASTLLLLLFLLLLLLLLLFLLLLRFRRSHDDPPSVLLSTRHGGPRSFFAGPRRAVDKALAVCAVNYTGSGIV